MLEGRRKEGAKSPIFRLLIEKEIPTITLYHQPSLNEIL
ncbi:hypothetical protein NHE_0684 [Neorickettsia helminthoeca str. Oregon]|uniref:Uncharacterized protein n=1 Tax=Neorickettsia helminthoeca str. Oregon TaxID=1286528 RepID=X5GX47_9RICK|nr:hypothetical protein NHE_0684 [Neorickettsia helminthoeca str. Oregon]